MLGADGVAGKQDCEKYPDYQRAGKHAGETRGKNTGVTFVNGENGKFLVLPDGVKGENTWTVGDKNAVRLVRE